MSISSRLIGLSNLLVWAVVLAPATALLGAALASELGPDPGNTLLHQSGLWGLRMLLLCLSMSTLRRWTGWPGWMRWRRRLGLAAFFYASLHLVSAWLFTIGPGWTALREAVLERPYIVLGLLAWLALWPLVLTSTRSARRRLGRRWLRLHRVVYGVAVLVSLHVLLQLRADWGEWLIYSLWLAILLAERLIWRGWRPRRGGS